MHCNEIAIENIFSFKFYGNYNVIPLTDEFFSYSAALKIFKAVMIISLHTLYILYTFIFSHDCYIARY